MKQHAQLQFSLDCSAADVSLQDPNVVNSHDHNSIYTSKKTLTNKPKEGSFIRTDGKSTKKIEANPFMAPDSDEEYNPFSTGIWEWKLTFTGEIQSINTN